MTFFRTLSGAFFGLVFFAQTAVAQDPKSPANAPALLLADSTNPALEAELTRQLQAVQTELKKLFAIAQKDTFCRFSPTLFDTVNSVQVDLSDFVYSTLGNRTNFPPDSSLYDEEYAYEDEDSSSLEYPMPSPDSTFSNLFKPKKTNRTIFSWGYSWGAADAIGTTNLAGSATAKAPDFDFVQSRHTRLALLLRTRLGKRDTSQNFDFSGGGKFKMGKMKRGKDQFRDSKVNLKYGLVFDRLKLEQTSDLVLALESGEPIFAIDPEVAQTKTNRLEIRYIEFPLLIEWMMSKRVKMEFGPFAGFRTRAAQALDYSRSPFEFLRTRRDELGLRKTNFGLMAGFGLKEIFLDAKLDLSSLFEKNERYDYRLLSLGATVGL